MDSDTNIDIPEDEEWIADEAFFESISKLREYARAEEAYGLQHSIGQLSDFGLFHLTVIEVAALITWDQQQTSRRSLSTLLGSDALHPTAPFLLDALQPEIQKQVEKLSGEIDAGRIAAPVIRRDNNSRIIPEMTYVGVSDIDDWLRQHCYVPGDAFLQFWRIAHERREQLLRHALYLRHRCIPDPPFPGIVSIETDLENADDISKEELVEQLKALVVQNKQLGLAAAQLLAQSAGGDDAPPGDHVSEKLSFLKQAAFRFWGNVKKDDRTTHPNNEEVAQWLVDHGYSATLADQAATIIRPAWAPTGRKPQK